MEVGCHGAVICVIVYRSRGNGNSPPWLVHVYYNSVLTSVGQKQAATEKAVDPNPPS